MTVSKQKDALIACCNGIIDNAEAITADWNFTQCYTLRIEFSPAEVPTVTVEKSFVPKGVIEVLQHRGGTK